MTAYSIRYTADYKMHARLNVDQFDVYGRTKCSVPGTVETKLEKQIYGIFLLSN